MTGKRINSGRRSRSRSGIFGTAARWRDAGRSSVRLNLASISATCPTLASSIAVPEVIEVAAGAKWGCMAAVMSLVPHNIAQ